MECSELMRPKNNYINKSWLNQFKNNKLFGHNILLFRCQQPILNLQILTFFYENFVYCSNFPMAAYWFSPSRRKKNRDKKRVRKNLWIQLLKNGYLLNEQDLLRYKVTK